MQVPALDRTTQRRTRREEAALTDHFVQVTRAHAIRKWPHRVGIRTGEQAAGSGWRGFAGHPGILRAYRYHAYRPGDVRAGSQREATSSVSSAMVNS